jgi:hypothetical protein
MKHLIIWLMFTLYICLSIDVEDNGTIYVKIRRAKEKEGRNYDDNGIAVGRVEYDRDRQYKFDL